MFSTSITAPRFTGGPDLKLPDLCGGGSSG
jgi:hypothetical protein